MMRLQQTVDQLKGQVHFSESVSGLFQIFSYLSVIDSFKACQFFCPLLVLFPFL